jgi:hypothetical protein
MHLSSNAQLFYNFDQSAPYSLGNLRQKSGHCTDPFLKPVFHFARIVAKRTGEHAQIDKRFINHVLPGVFAYQNKKFVASQLFGVVRKY